MRSSLRTPALAAAVAILTVAIARLAASGEPSDPAENGPETWTFDAHQKIQPLVELSHFRHASSKGLKIPCTRCHHTSKGTDVEAGCGECHRTAWDADVPDIKSATHELCVRCHVQHNAAPAAKPAPYKCRGCHRGAAPPK